MYFLTGSGWYEHDGYGAVSRRTNNHPTSCTATSGFEFVVETIRNDAYNRLKLHFVRSSVELKDGMKLNCLAGVNNNG